MAREVDRLAEVGLLETELRHGRRFAWAPTDSPIFDELSSLLLKTIRPKAVLEKRLAGIPGIDQAFIYGSWARRYQGRPGPFPQDIDVMVIGSVAVTEIRDEAEAASRRLGRDVNATVLTSTEWMGRRDGFIDHVKSEPMVVLELLA